MALISKNRKIEYQEKLSGKLIASYCGVEDNEYFKPHYNSIIDYLDELLNKVFDNKCTNSKNFKIQGYCNYGFQLQAIEELKLNKNISWEIDGFKYVDFINKGFDTVYSSHKLELKQIHKKNKYLALHIYIHGSSLGILYIEKK